MPEEITSSIKLWLDTFDYKAVKKEDLEQDYKDLDDLYERLIKRGFQIRDLDPLHRLKENFKEKYLDEKS